MTLRRYSRTPILGLGRQYGTSYAATVIREGMRTGRIRFETSYLKEGERLDTIAGQVYGDGQLWWILAAASNIGWMLQVPPYTQINIPVIGDVEAVLG